MRLAAALTMGKIAFLHRVPYFLARLGETGDEDHHLVTPELLSDASLLKPFTVESTG